MVFFLDNWKPVSFYDRIAENCRSGFHTLILLDIKVKEQSLENMARGRKVYEPPRYMTVSQCAAQLLETETTRGERVYGPDSLATGVARIGSANQDVAVGTLAQMCQLDMGAPLHSLILLGRRTHDLEREFIREFAIDKDVFDEVWRRDYASNH